MTNPITWQNVQGNSPAQAVAPLDFARQSFKDAFSGLGDVLKQREATDASNAVQSRENATQDMLGAMRQATTPEEFAAQKADFAASMQNQGAGIDRAKVGAFMDNRLATLYNQSKSASDYSNTQRDDASAPFRDAYLTAIRSGNKEAAAAAMDGYNKANGRDASSLAVANDEQNQRVTTRQQTVDSLKLASDRQGAELEHWANSDANASANTKIAKDNSDSQGRVAGIAEMERYEKVIANKREQIAASGDLASSRSVLDSVNKAIAASPRSDEWKLIASRAIPGLAAIPGMTGAIMTNSVNGLSENGYTHTRDGLVDTALQAGYAALADKPGQITRGNSAAQTEALRNELGDLLTAQKKNAADNADDSDVTKKGAPSIPKTLNGRSATNTRFNGNQEFTDIGDMRDTSPGTVAAVAKGGVLNLPVPLAKDYVGESDATKLSNFARNSVKQFGDWNTSFNDKLEQGMLRQKINSNSELTPLERRNAIKAGLLQVKPTPIKY